MKKISIKEKKARLDVVADIAENLENRIVWLANDLRDSEDRLKGDPENTYLASSIETKRFDVAAVEWLIDALEALV